LPQSNAIKRGDVNETVKAFTAVSSGTVEEWKPEKAFEIKVEGNPAIRFKDENALQQRVVGIAEECLNGKEKEEIALKDTIGYIPKIDDKGRITEIEIPSANVKLEVKNNILVFESIKPEAPKEKQLAPSVSEMVAGLTDMGVSAPAPVEEPKKFERDTEKGPKIVSWSEEKSLKTGEFYPVYAIGEKEYLVDNTGKVSSRSGEKASEAITNTIHERVKKDYVDNKELLNKMGLSEPTEVKKEQKLPETVEKQTESVREIGVEYPKPEAKKEEVLGIKVVSKEEGEKGMEDIREKERRDREELRKKRGKKG